MKLIYTVEFDIGLDGDPDAFPGEALAANINAELEKAAHSAFTTAICAIDDQEIRAGNQAAIAALKQWGSKVTQSR